MNARDFNNSAFNEREATIASVLGRASWYDLLSDAERNAVASESREVITPEGGCLFTAGEQPRGWYCVMEGILKWTSISEDGRSCSIAGLCAGSWFGEASLVRDKAYDYHVIALRQSRVLLIPHETCERLFKRQSVFSQAVMRNLAERVNLFMAAVTIKTLANVETRIARTIASMYHKELHPRTQLYLRLSQEEIANLCGVSRQRCNRVLKLLQKMRLIDVGYSGISVLDIEGLRCFNNSATCLPFV